MKYWKNIITGEIVQQDNYPGWSWVEIFCSCPDFAGEDKKCPVHGGDK